MKCLRCDATVEPGADECRCGCVAFYHGRRPDWPPIVAIPHDSRMHDCGHGKGASDDHDHATFAAFLLGPVPPAPNLRHFADSHRDVAMPKSRRSA